MRVTSHGRGLLAEKKAEIFLILKGYRIIERRFKTPVGEIDLIATRGKTLIFVEVKHRASSTAACEAVHERNQVRVAQAATLYLQRYPAYNDHDMRFDAVILAPGAWPQHIKAAWDMTAGF